jgi:hypothetical protein
LIDEQIDGFQVKESYEECQRGHLFFYMEESDNEASGGGSHVLRP